MTELDNSLLTDNSYLSCYSFCLSENSCKDIFSCFPAEAFLSSVTILT